MKPATTGRFHYFNNLFDPGKEPGQIIFCAPSARAINNPWFALASGVFAPALGAKLHKKPFTPFPLFGKGAGGIGYRLYLARPPGTLKRPAKSEIAAKWSHPGAQSHQFVALAGRIIRHQYFDHYFLSINHTFYHSINWIWGMETHPAPVLSYHHDRTAPGFFIPE